MAALGINFASKKWTAKVGNVTVRRNKIESGSIDNACALCSGDTRFKYWSWLSQSLQNSAGILLPVTSQLLSDVHYTILLSAVNFSFTAVYSRYCYVLK